MYEKVKEPNPEKLTLTKAQTGYGNIYKLVSVWDIFDIDIETNKFEHLPGVVFEEKAITFAAFVES